jgi:hypothetical protein
MVSASTVLFFPVVIDTDCTPGLPTSHDMVKRRNNRFRIVMKKVNPPCLPALRFQIGICVPLSKPQHWYDQQSVQYFFMIYFWLKYLWRALYI